MKKAMALIMVGVIVISSLGTVVHAQTDSKWNLEDELTNSDDILQDEEIVDENFYQEDDNSMILASLWLGSQHNDLVSSVMKYFETNKRKNTIESCLRFGAVRADDEPLHAKGMGQIHGLHNYLLHLNALWLYSKKIGVSNQTDKNCKALVLNEIVVKGSNDRNNLEELLNTIPEIYKLYKKQTGHQPTNFEKQYLVLGLALHLIGDTYAHRTLVTLEGVEQALVDGVMKRSDFASEKAFDEFCRAVRRGEVRCSQIDGQKWLKKDTVNPYEDDPRFMSKRYTYSKRAAKEFINAYVQNNATFKAEYIKNNIDGIALENYNNYL